MQISRAAPEEGVVRIEDLTRKDKEPLPQKAACILPLFAYTKSKVSHYLKANLKAQYI